jgi:translation initiation factor 2B subunit (eIF-2B alpha/beta/delta family)
MTLLVTISTLAATSEANMRQAQSASRVAEEFLNKQAKEGDDEKSKELAEAVEKKNSELKEAREGKLGACYYFYRFYLIYFFLQN